jgi:hypothetical protein
VGVGARVRAREERYMEGCAPISVGRLDEGARVEEQAHEILILHHHGHVERRGPVVPSSCCAPAHQARRTPRHSHATDPTEPHAAHPRRLARAFAPLVTCCCTHASPAPPELA